MNAFEDHEDREEEREEERQEEAYDQGGSFWVP